MAAFPPIHRSGFTAGRKLFGLSPLWLPQQMACSISTISSPTRSLRGAKTRIRRGSRFASYLIFPVVWPGFQPAGERLRRSRQGRAALADVAEPGKPSSMDRRVAGFPSVLKDKLEGKTPTDISSAVSCAGCGSARSVILMTGPAIPSSRRGSS